MEEGAFDNLPWRGRPIPLGDDEHVPEDLRLAYRVLKNAGFLPPEAEARKEIATLADLLDRVADGEERRRLRRRVEALRLQLSAPAERRAAARVMAATARALRPA
jgi:hypothetical protein